MRVYLAGPMTGIPEFNYPVFNQAAFDLRSSGYEVVNPAENHGGDQSLPWKTYLQTGVHQVMECDAIALLPGWHESEGAQLELAIARAFDLRVFDHHMREEHDPNSEFRKFDNAHGFGLYESSTGGQKLNVGKVGLHLLPAAALTEVARVLDYGATKYAPHNWRKGISWEFTLGSILRHTFALMKGEDLDPETGISHAAHAACQALFLTEFMVTETGQDDRYTSQEIE